MQKTDQISKNEFIKKHFAKLEKKEIEEKATRCPHCKSRLLSIMDRSINICPLCLCNYGPETEVLRVWKVMEII